MTFIDPGEPGTLVDRLVGSFTERYERRPAVVGRAPGRVNLIGEHVDYNGGPVLPLALPHATYAAVAARDDGTVRLASRQTEEIWSGAVEDIGPGAVDGWAAYAAGVLWALRESGHEVPGVDVLVDSTVPLGAGLSSSAALECSVAVGVVGMLGLDLSDGLRTELARLCVRAETEVAGAPTGGMDQAVAMLATEGAAVLVDFGDDSTRQVPLRLAEHRLLVTDTRVSHELTDGGYGARRAQCEAAAEALGLETLREARPDDVERLADPVQQRRVRHVVSEIGRVADTVAAVEAGTWVEVGALLQASHTSLRDDFEVSCDELDLTVVTAVEAGALGARMTGGGFGGSAVSLVPVDRLEAVARAVDHAFAAAALRAPRHLVADATAGADVWAVSASGTGG